MKLVTANEMQAIDRFTIEEVGIPGEVLMENAARGALEHIKTYILKHLSDAVIGVLCGKGNNGEMVLLLHVIFIKKVIW